jgi:two-component system cell cycle sensor histidine kinase/response regulator CckA
LPAQMEAARGGGVNAWITRNKKKDGSVIDVEVISRPIVYNGCEARLALANNITERKAAEDRIHEQAMLLDLAHDAIFVRDMAGRIQFWNKGAERLYGLTAAEAVGKAASDIFTHDFTGSLRAAEKILLETGEWSGELSKHAKAGKEAVVVDSRWTLLRNAQGEPQSVLVINTDVTEKKKLEAQFLRSQRMESIGTLATGMAHDLNNILAPILMSAGVLRWETTAEDKELAISRIESSVQRGAEIIQQVLTFGRGVSGERVGVNPGELIKDLSKICTQTFPKDVVLTVDVNANVWPIIGDKTQLHQVLLNLCINARDAMPQGGRLSMKAENFMVDESFASAHAPMQTGPYVRLEISDTGEGIPAANLEKIFEPFFTTKEFGKGTGLGLSTVLGIVKSHHGLVLVESEVNRGATFKVLLPASIVVAKSSAPGAAAELPHGRGETILLVDDEADIVSATRKMLEQHGYNTVVANFGKEALAIFTRDHPSIDLVVTDIMMPGMDGIELIHALRGVSPRVKIIASSGLGRDLAGGLRGKELEALGIRTFLAKPYTAEKLLTALHGMLGGNLTDGKTNPESKPELVHG